MLNLREEEKRAWAEAGKPFEPLKVTDETSEIGERGAYIPDAHFEKLKRGLCDKTMKYLDKHWPLPQGSIRTTKGRKPHKPKSWSIKNQTPKLRESDVLEMLGTEEL